MGKRGNLKVANPGSLMAGESKKVVELDGREKKLNSWKRTVFSEMPLTYHVAQHSSEALSLLKQGWHKHMPLNPRSYRHISDTRWTVSNTGVSNSTRGAIGSHVIFWFPENEPRDGRFQCSERLIWTAAAIRPHWPLLLEFQWGEK